ncbi:recombinase family protein [Tsukamurella paurometabola]|uniref:DNA-invertase hin n=1 Tax=Tsukamurella paurometabola TaxID=2061 RepID=A0A3P8L6A3_TSUPA|nr:recombinase family protein [Tsukamurella paurometabola]UEA81625.1 recombinase family protein [Tsukamurella paurometabola]VDR38631.1 DNA-invertase hin [Tsukamurella paurometabola]
MTNSYVLGYARVSTEHQSLDAQRDALLAAGVPAERIRAEKASASPGSARPELAALLEHARPGDTIVVAAVDRLGRDVPEMSSTIRDLREREIVVRARREGLDSSTAVGEAMMNLLIAVGGIELAYGKERRAAAREARAARGLSNGRPKALPDAKAAQLVRLVQAGEPVAAAAEAFGISRATAYRIVRTASVGDAA